MNKRNRICVLASWGEGVHLYELREKDGDFEFVASKQSNSFGRIILPRFASYSSCVILLPPKDASTIHAVVRVKRARPDEIIDENELETLLFKGLWEFLGKYRIEASKRLGVEESLVSIAHLDVHEVRIGNHAVFNPLEFKGKDLSFRFRVTFVRRDFMKVFERMKEKSENFFIVEGGSVLADISARPPSFVALIQRTHILFYNKGVYESSFESVINGGSGAIEKKIADSLSISHENARYLIKKYSAKGLSEKVKKFAEMQFKAVYQEISKDILKHMKKADRENVMIMMFDEIPIAETWLKFPGRKISIQISLPMNRVKAVMGVVRRSEQYALFSKMLQRRAKWLTPNS